MSLRIRRLREGRCGHGCLWPSGLRVGFLSLLLAFVLLPVMNQPPAGATQPPPPPCSGAYFKFMVQVSTDGGTNWSYDSLSLDGIPGQSADLTVQTAMTTGYGQTQAWSFGLKHDPSSLHAYGGDMTLTEVTVSGTNTQGVQAGGPPDLEVTEKRAGYNGYTQGVVIDMESTAVTLPPTSFFVTSRACYRITFPSQQGVYQATLRFTNDVGDPPIERVITQSGVSRIPCARNFTLYVRSSLSQAPTASVCAIPPTGGASEGGGELSGSVASLESLAPSAGIEGGAQAQGGQSQCQDFDCPGPECLNCPSFPPPPALPPECRNFDFIRGDADGNGSVPGTTADPLRILNFLFFGGPAPGCRDAADTNGDNGLNITDGVYLLNYLFLSGSAPPAPFPGCGPDPTADSIDCQIYEACVNSGNDPDGDGLTSVCENALCTETEPRICLDAANPDTDGDGFSDGEEVLPTGVPGCAGGSVNLRVLCASPFRKDIFVEIDWMDLPGDHTHLPSATLLKRVVCAFRARGIYLHLDTGVEPFNLGGGEALPHENSLVDFGRNPFLQSPHAQNPEEQPPFYRLKSQYFDPNRCNVFHYNIWVHTIDTSRFSGLARDVLGDDFIVSLGNSFWNGTGANGMPLWPDQETLQGATFMHELGPTLNLRHGGFEDAPELKPHYRSVMSGRYQLEGIDTDCQVGGDGILDYSDEVLPTLTERADTLPDGTCVGGLDERVGMCGGVPINWDLDTVDPDHPEASIDTVPVCANINCSPPQYSAVGFDPCYQADDPILDPQHLNISNAPQYGYDDWNNRGPCFEGVCACTGLACVEEDCDCADYSKMRFDIRNSVNRMPGGAEFTTGIPEYLRCAGYEGE